MKCSDTLLRDYVSCWLAAAWLLGWLAGLLAGWLSGLLPGMAGRERLGGGFQNGPGPDLEVLAGRCFLQQATGTCAAG